MILSRTKSAPRFPIMLESVKLTSTMRRTAASLANYYISKDVDCWADDSAFSDLQGAKFLGHGLYRCAFRVGGYVYKVGSLNSAREGGNLTERFFLKRLREDGWGWFAPDAVTIPHGEWTVNVMHYYRANSMGYDYYTTNVGREVSELLESEYEYEDVNTHNLIMTEVDSGPVLLDGGNWFHEIQSVPKAA